jgi:hypothetical protein
MLWDFHNGYRYVGPFVTVEAANDWGIFYEDELAGSPCWHSELVDPAAPLEIRAPDDIAVEPTPTPDFDKWLDEREPPLSNTPGAAFFLLMTDSEPLHLVGPFAAHSAAYTWGLFNELVRHRDFGWQVVWLENPTAPPQIQSADEATASLPMMTH